MSLKFPSERGGGFNQHGVICVLGYGFFKIQARAGSISNRIHPVVVWPLQKIR